MKEKINEVKNEIELFLMNNKEKFEMSIDCILINPETEETITIANNNHEALVFSPHTKDSEKNFSNYEDWNFNFDWMVFEELEGDYQIGFISNRMHYNIWQTLNELYPQRIDHKDGVQRYLQFCADNKITKEYLDKELNSDTPDAMKFFEGLALFETMTYKGYVIAVDKVNHDSPKESIVYIYKSQQDYINGNSAKRISLNTIGLKQNVKEYLDKIYIDKAKLEIEKTYYAFALGYDLLNDIISKYDTLECDINFEFCYNLVNQFLNSKEYSEFSHSNYENLQEWVNKNQERIEQEYKETIGFEDKIYNGNLKILDKGFRKDEPVALVEKDVPSMNRKEYIVVFNYVIDEKNNDLHWGYGKYYYDKNSGQEAYQIVINGGNLAFKDREER